ncbi:MAG: DUF481 domain-containing protein [Methyloprofundus sp.]|nr:DUF481 domain-containing protein [Methyloprofundus sp.]
MSTKQIFLCLSIFLLSTTAYAQSIQFSNGDTLDVELIHQTGTTITFSHPALGTQTIAKAKINNLQELNLEKLTILTESELKQLLKVRVAQAEVLVAKEGVNTAEAKLLAAKETVDMAEEADSKDAEEKLILAGEKFTAAQEEVKVAEDKLKVVKNVIVAEAELLIAKGKVKVAEAEVNVIRLDVEVAEAEEYVAEEQEIIVAEEKLVVAGEKFIAAKEEVKAAEDGLLVVKNVIVTEAEPLLAKAQVDAVVAEIKDTQLELDADEAEENIAEEQGIVVTELKTETAEEKVEIAEENVKVATQQVEVAEDNLKLAKGEKVGIGFMGTGWFKDWDSSIALGLRGSSGQSVNASFRADFNTRYEDADHRWDFKSFYLFASDDNISSDNRVNAVLVKDWFFSETRWFAFASTMYDWDEFKDWKHRWQFSVGPGYQFIKTDEWEFSGRVGGTGIFEFDRTVEDSSSPTGYSEINTLGFEAMIGADLVWHITAKQHFTLSNYFYPSLTDAGEFRNLTIISWVHSIDWFEGLAIKLGIRNEYDTVESIPNDFNYNFSVLWGF